MILPGLEGRLFISKILSSENFEHERISRQWLSGAGQMNLVMTGFMGWMVRPGIIRDIHLSTAICFGKLAYGRNRVQQYFRQVFVFLDQYFDFL